MLLKRKSIEFEESSRQAKCRRVMSNRKAIFAPVTLSEQGGIRYLHFGTEWIQGAMRLSKPNWLELEYSRKMVTWMLFKDHPENIMQLGLGSAALAKFCYNTFPDSVNTVVEINPDVINICHAMFAMPPDDERLITYQMDAMDFVTDASNHHTQDIIQTDLYDASARGPVLDSLEFYRGCRDCLKDGGIMSVNLFGADHPSFEKNMKHIRANFAYVICLPAIAEGNIITLAFTEKPEIDFEVLEQKARAVKALTGLPTIKWLKDFKKALKPSSLSIIDKLFDF